MVVVVCLSIILFSVTEFEVVILQTWSGTVPSLGPYLVLCLTNPTPPLSTFTWILSLHPPCPYIPPCIHHPDTELHRSLCTILISFFLVLESLSTWTCVHSRQPPPPVPDIAVLFPSDYSPGPSWPI